MGRERSGDGQEEQEVPPMVGWCTGWAPIQPRRKDDDDPHTHTHTLAMAKD